VNPPKPARRPIPWLPAGLLALLPAANPARACSVCYGDPESDMAQGALWGVLVLGVIVYGVLMGMVGVGITWLVKARRIQAAPVRDEQGVGQHPG